MKIYTKSGDRGKTSLFSGDRVPKHHRRVQAYGTVDELCSVLGWVAAILPETTDAIEQEIRQIQSDLFDVGAWLSTKEDSPQRYGLAEIDDERIAYLEAAIDRMEKTLPPLKTFVLPGGHPAGAAAHVARTVCRRAERRVVALTERSLQEAVGRHSLDRILSYLNRLSDYLFVVARFINQSTGVEDIPWRG